MAGRGQPMSTATLKETEGILGALRNALGDDDQVVGAMLAALSEVVSPELLRKTAIGWCDDRGVSGQDQKLADGSVGSAEGTPRCSTVFG
ncbi:hypothetical protein DIPPA_26511 [Diplonema papillatum]|nr:hypothetical protein DIPPA_26511 [Diplonema papillatum]